MKYLDNNTTKELTKTTIKLYPILHDHHPPQINEFTLYNKHKAIVNLLNNPKLKVILQIERMALRLQRFNFNFEIC